jgi:predicted Na+-dependent transporter
MSATAFLLVVPVAVGAGIGMWRARRDATKRIDGWVGLAILVLLVGALFVGLAIDGTAAAMTWGLLLMVTVPLLVLVGIGLEIGYRVGRKGSSGGESS